MTDNKKLQPVNDSFSKPIPVRSATGASRSMALSLSTLKADSPAGFGYVMTDPADHDRANFFVRYAAEEYSLYLTEISPLPDTNDNRKSAIDFPGETIARFNPSNQYEILSFTGNELVSGPDADSADRKPNALLCDML